MHNCMQGMCYYVTLVRVSLADRFCRFIPSSLLRARLPPASECRSLVFVLLSFHFVDRPFALSRLVSSTVRPHRRPLRHRSLVFVLLSFRFVCRPSVCFLVCAAISLALQLPASVTFILRVRAACFIALLHRAHNFPVTNVNWIHFSFLLGGP